MSHDIHIAGSDVRFHCEEGQTILDAALKAGIEMPYSCSRGVCGNCAGTIRRSSAAPGAPQRELYCQVVPDEDLEIVPDSWRRLDPGARKIIKVKVYRNDRVTHDVSVLQLRLPAGQRAKFRAGQYLQVLLPDGGRRAYSMANPPQQNDLLTLHVRHVADGRFTRLLESLSTGDALSVELPFGSIELPAVSGEPLLCVAGGTGFAPIKSVLDDLAHRGTDRPVSLIWGGREAGDLYLLPAIERWQKQLKNFTFVAAVEHPGDAPIGLSSWVAGRVDDAIRAHCKTLASYDAYCCGAPAMVEAVRRVCVGELGLDDRRFHADAFVPGGAGP